MTRLTLRLLGGFEVRAESGQPVALPTRKYQALLAYLALSPGASYPRDKLTALLWGDTTDRRARHSLRQALSTLRKLLAAATGTSDVLTLGERVALDASLVSVDAVQLEQRAREGTIQALEDAMDLYRGDLLEGLPLREPGFEDWLVPERERLRELAQEVLARLVVLHEKRGALDFAIRSAQRLLAFDPLQETAHRALMRLYHRDGRRAAALRQYQACVDLLQRELGTEPESQTRELYHDLLRRRRAGAPATTRESGPVPPGPPGRGGPVVIGRDTELARLKQAFDGACRGEGSVVAVVGEAGVGKSRLLEELAATATARGARVVMARAHEMEGALPLGPWIDGLQNALRGSAGLLEGLSPVWTAHLAQILPDLGPAAARPARTSDDALRLFEAVAQLLGHLASTGPLLIVLEDLHWADETSLNLLAFVSRRLAGRAVLLVVSAQEEEGTPHLARLLRAVDEQGATTLRLGRLSRPATLALVRALVGRGRRVSARRLGAQVWTLSEGNPFMIVEGVRAAGERRRPASADVPLPDRIRNVVLGRLERLTETAQRLAAAAAVIGREFEFALLWRVVRLDERRAAEGVEELVRRGLLRAAGELLVFTHDSIRRVAYERLLAPTRRELHQASVEALEALHAGRLEDVHDRLAHHCTEAGLRDKAIGYLTAAAEQHVRHYVLPEAIGAFRKAIELTEQRTGPDQERRLIELCLRLAFALSVQGRFDELLTLLRAHEPRLARMNDPALAAPFHFRFALTQLYRGELADCVAAADRALAAATAAGLRPIAGQVHYVLAFHDYWIGRLQSGVAHARQAVAGLEDAGQPHWLGLACWILARNLLLLGDFEASLETAARTTAIGVAIDDARLRSLGGATTASVQILLGDVEAGVAGCRRARDEATDPVTIGSALHWLGVALIELGAADDAVRALEESMQRYRASGLRLAQGRSVATLAEAYRLRGDIARARELTEESLRLTRDDPFGWGMAQRALARLALDAGALVDAERHAQESVRSFGAIGATFELARARDLLAGISASGLPSASARG